MRDNPKVYCLPANEAWCCDDIASDWMEHSIMACDRPEEADVIWLLSSWRWRSLPIELLRSKLSNGGMHPWEQLFCAVVCEQTKTQY